MSLEEIKKKKKRKTGGLSVLEELEKYNKLLS